MTAREIQNLLRQLPKESPYLRWARQFRELHPLSPPDPRELALFDPAFGWHFAKSHAEAGVSLPGLAVPAAWVRAYRSLLQPGHADLSIALTQALNLPESKPQRDLLCALLVCPDTTPHLIAELCQLEVEVVLFFESLYWNCLDRKHDRLYLGRLCHQIGPTRAHSKTQSDLGLQLLRVAWQDGRAELVVAAAGVASPTEPISTQGLFQQVRKGILTSAAEGLALGKFDETGNPFLKQALKIMAVSLKGKPTEPPVAEVSIEDAIRMTFKYGLSLNQANYQI